MDKHDVFCKIVKFMSITSSTERCKAIKDPTFAEQAIIDILKEMVDDEELVDRKMDYKDHIELLTEYHCEGISALDYFVSFSQIESNFVEFSYGIDSFEKRKDYLLATPFLSDCKSIKCINRFIQRETDMPNSVLTQYRLYRNLLKACRVIGINEAFDEFATPDDKYINAMNILFKADNIYALISILGNYKDSISSKYMRNCFHYLQAKYEQDKQMRDTIIANWDAISSFQPIERNIWFWEPLY